MCHCWNAATEEVTKEWEVQPAPPHPCQLRAAHSSSRVLKDLPQQTLCHLHFAALHAGGCSYKEQGEVSAWTLSFAELGKSWETIPSSLTEPWERGALCLAAPTLLLGKQIMLPVARVQSKVILLRLLEFSPGFLRSAERLVWAFIQILGKSLPPVLPCMSSQYDDWALQTMNILISKLGNDENRAEF